MRLWLARGSEVSIREQLVTQIILGVLGNDLKPGQRLPSTRELARRFNVHPNTVSAGYRQLEKARWVEFRHGSGVYVRQNKPDTPLSPDLFLDQILLNTFQSARELGIRLPELRSRMARWLDLQPPDHLLLIESDEELRNIVVAEIEKVAALPVADCGIDALTAEILRGSIPMAFPTSADRVQDTLPAPTDLLRLSFRSVPSSLAEWLPAPSGILIGIASRWPKFLAMARTMLTAAGVEADTLVLRDARERNWQRGLSETAAVICDLLTANELTGSHRAIMFPLLSEASIRDIQRYEQFVSDPLATSSI